MMHMSEKECTHIITASFILLCFIYFTMVTGLYFGGNKMSEDSSCCKFMIAGIIALIVFILTLIILNCCNKPKFAYFSEESGIGVSKIGKSKEYADVEYFCFLDDEKKIDENMFLGCKKLIMVKLPNEITEIPKYTFAGCGKLSDAEIPSKVEKIKDYAFLGCTSLAKVSIPASVKEIEKYAFANCRAIHTLVFNSETINIADTVFKGCDSLKEITVQSENATEFYENNKKWLNTMSDDCLIKSNDKPDGISMRELKQGAES